MKQYLSLIDESTDGRRCDVTPIFRDPDAFRLLVNDLAAACSGQPFTVVAGIDALGFILGSALALAMGVGFVPIRKGGKLPVATDNAEFEDYDGERTRLEVRRGAFAPGEKVLIVDEWIETGAQAFAAAALVEGQGGVVAGIGTIHCDENAMTELLRERYSVRALRFG